jgi:hypothetical protein
MTRRRAAKISEEVLSHFTGKEEVTFPPTWFSIAATTVNFIYVHLVMTGYSLDDREVYFSISSKSRSRNSRIRP